MVLTVSDRKIGPLSLFIVAIMIINCTSKDSHVRKDVFVLSVCRFQHDRERPAESANNMRRLLTHLQNLPLKRKIATDLGLSDVLQSLSPTQDEGFLNNIARL